LILNV